MQLFKKNEKRDYTPDIPANQFFNDARKILLTAFVSSAVTLFAFGIVTYFTVLSNTTRIAALESDSVRKDVLTEVLTPMKDDISETKLDIKDIKKDSSDTKNDIAVVKGILQTGNLHK